MKSVWITGASGLIGSHLVKTAPTYAPGLDILGLTHTRVDLTDFAAVRRAFADHKPALIIHCAALAKPAECEANPKLARLNNVDATQNLIDLAAGIPFVFFSTDLVFDGQNGNYIETDPVSPITVYAESKVVAEDIVRTNPNHLILRAGLNAGRSASGTRAFNEQIRLAWQAGRTLDLFVDEFRCPIPVLVTARAVWELVTKGVTGTYHLGGSEKLSRYEIGKLLATRCPELNPKIVPGTLKDYQGPPRTPDVSMICTKVQSRLSFPLPKFSEWLAANPQEPV